MQSYKVNKKSAQIFQKGIYKWSKNNPRPMPWKNESDPYKIWISEIILQQTRVSQGWEYYNRFVKLFPTIKSLAQAPLTSILKAWEGLGYYTRARNLYSSANILMSKYNGCFPNKYEDILSLKGVGTYTASAIASFAFDLPYAVLDGNVHRILSRYLSISKPMNTSLEKKEFQNIANDFLDTRSPGKYNQAIMDFGATCCTPLNPKCKSCPLSINCQAFITDKVFDLPPPKKKIKKTERYFHYLVIHRNGKILVNQRSELDIWQGLHEFYLLESDTAKLPKPPTGLHLAINQKAKPIIVDKQILSHQIIHTFFYTAISETDFDFISPQKIKKLAFPNVINRNLETIISILHKQKKA